jgi:hypothetical protein
MAGPPRDRMFAFIQERMRSFQARESMDPASVLPGWKREYAVMCDLKNLLEWLERQELERVTAADKPRAKR